MNIQKIQTRIADIVITGTSCRSTHAEMHARFMEIVLTPLNSRAPSGRRRHSAYLSGYAEGFYNAHMEHVWRDQVEFCYRDVDGVLYSVWRESTHRLTEEFYKAGRGCELGNMECAHVWCGTNKPFTSWAFISKAGN